MENNIKNKDLKKACEVLNLKYEDFVEIEEVQKGTTEIDYKILYEQQKSINQELLVTMGKLPSLISDNFKTNFQEIQKGLSNLKEDFDLFGEHPMHNKKSYKNISVVEKGIESEGKKADQTFSLSSKSDLRVLKKFLGDKTMSELTKGVKDSVYERAALQLDSTKQLNLELVKEILAKDNILIKD